MFKNKVVHKCTLYYFELCIIGLVAIFLGHCQLDQMVGEVTVYLTNLVS